jgi:C1A family cysteine protease
MAIQIRRLGWQPDVPDQRDFTYAAPMAIMAKPLPPTVDLSKQCPPVYDQGQIGSCTANAIAAAIEFDQKKESQQEFTPSRLFIYYNERDIEHTVPLDAGAQIRDGIKSVAKLGVCPEPMWPYKDDHPQQEGEPCPTCSFAKKPTAQCYTEAKKHLVKSYARVPRNLSLMRGCLASGFPFVLGFSCYSNLPFQSTDGIIPLPGSGDSRIGGHAVLAVGYDDNKHLFMIRNSWGTTWGVNGYGFLPYAYLLDANLSDDFWSIKTV